LSHASNIIYTDIHSLRDRQTERRKDEGTDKQTQACEMRDAPIGHAAVSACPCCPAYWSTCIWMFYSMYTGT